jgi:hypothetical protein
MSYGIDRSERGLLHAHLLVRERQIQNLETTVALWGAPLLFFTTSFTGDADVETNSIPKPPRVFVAGG